MNPVSGGRPPRDRRIKGMSAEIIGALVHEIVRVPIVVALFMIKIRKVDDVITM